MVLCDQQGLMQPSECVLPVVILKHSMLVMRMHRGSHEMKQEEVLVSYQHPTLPSCKIVEHLPPGWAEGGHGKA